MMTELFTPAKIGSCEIPNRLIVPAMVMNLCTEDGMITERYIKYIEEKAKGGWGMVITEDLGHDHHRRLCSKCEREGL